MQDVRQRSDDEAGWETGDGSDGPDPRAGQEGMGPRYADMGDPVRFPVGPITRLDEVVIGDAPEPFLTLVHPEPGAMTVLFGDGSSGKGTLAAWVAAQATQQGYKVLLLDAEGHKMEWARRIMGFGGLRHRVLHWEHPIGIPKLDDYTGVVDLIILDSAAYFTAGDDAMMGSEGATRLQAALALTKVPCMVIAHVSKGIDTDKPYGSVFWHNAARVTWRLAEVDGKRVLKCFKATDVKGLHKGDTWHVEVEYLDDGLTPVWLELKHPEAMTFTSPVKQIADMVLADGEEHVILDFTLHGHSATAYRLLLDSDPTVTRGTRPTPGGGRPAVTWQRSVE